MELCFPFTGDKVYNVTDNAGENGVCYVGYCNASCKVEIHITSCPTTPTPTSTTPTVCMYMDQTLRVWTLWKQCFTFQCLRVQKRSITLLQGLLCVHKTIKQQSLMILETWLYSFDFFSFFTKCTFKCIIQKYCHLRKIFKSLSGSK